MDRRVLTGKCEQQQVTCNSNNWLERCDLALSKLLTFVTVSCGSSINFPLQLILEIKRRLPCKLHVHMIIVGTAVLTAMGIMYLVDNPFQLIDCSSGSRWSNIGT